MSSRRIEDLDKRIQPIIKNFLDEANKVTSPWLTFITDGFRTYAEQAELYASGRTKEGKILTNAKPGTSNHEKGLAVDIAFQNGGVLSYDQSLYDKIVPIAKKLTLDWGGDWTGFPDRPHFEKLKFDDVPPEAVEEKLPKKSVVLDILVSLTGLDQSILDDTVNAYMKSGLNIREIVEDVCSGNSNFINKWLKPKLESKDKLISELSSSVSSLTKERNVLKQKLEDIPDGANTEADIKLEKVRKILWGKGWWWIKYWNIQEELPKK